MIGATKTIVRLIAASGPFGPIWRSLSGCAARIVVYHKFRDSRQPPEDGLDIAMLRRQLHHICRHYRVLPLRELGRLLQQGEIPADRTLAITVDDGHVSFARLAWPVFREFGVPVTLFAISALTDSGAWLWAEQFEYIRRNSTGARKVAGSAWQGILAEMKTLAPPERDACLAELAHQGGVELPVSLPAEHALLSWHELQELARTPLVDIGSHTRTHPILATLSDQDAAEEVIQSRLDLQSRLGVDVECFCYPNGMPGDQGTREAGFIRQAGYTCAVASHLGYVSAGADRFALPRIGGGVPDWSTFCKYLDGLEYVQQRWRSPD